jgi:sugar diacid utilization regulator
MYQVTTQSTAPSAVLDLVWEDLRRPLGLVDRRGRPLAAVPEGAAGQAALSVASRRVLDGAAAADAEWLFEPVCHERRRVGMLAMAGRLEPSVGDLQLLKVVASFCGDQLHRAALERAVKSERRARLRRRIVTHAGLSHAGLLAEARAAGLSLTGYYWPALVWWREGELTQQALRHVAAVAAQGQRPSLLVPLDHRILVLLFADHGPGDQRREAVHSWVARVVHEARRTAGLSGVHILAADGSAAPADVAASVDGLLWLTRCQARPWAGAEVPEARSFAVERLLGDSLDRGRARAFVIKRIGRLLAHDGAHGTDLGLTLELALDYPLRDEAARQASMHRNTFRRQLRHALDLVDADADDPDDRLALHVALRLARLLGLAAGRTTDAAARPGTVRRDSREHQPAPRP